MQNREPILLTALGMTEEEAIGANKILEQIIEQCDEPLCIATEDEDFVKLRTYNMSLEESHRFVDMIQSKAHVFGFKTYEGMRS